QSSDESLLKQGRLFPYIRQTSLFRCPSDDSLTRNYPRTRSYSMNGWVGSRYMESNSSKRGYRTFVSEEEVAAVGAASVWIFIDEHEASIDDAFFLVTMDDTRPFASRPASRHGSAFELVFADAHAELFKLRDAESATLNRLETVSPKNTDWLRLKSVT